MNRPLFRGVKSNLLDFESIDRVGEYLIEASPSHAKSRTLSMTSSKESLSKEPTFASVMTLKRPCKTTRYIDLCVRITYDADALQDR